MKIEVYEFLISLLLLLLSCIYKGTEAVFCYQCGSSQEPKGVDLCGAYKAFDSSKHIAVECYSEEAVTPGQFCLKRIELSPRAYIWDGRWKSVIRRCALMTNRGLNVGCDWGYTARGAYWEECYCTDNGCNGAEKFRISRIIPLLASVFTIIMTLKWF